MGNDDAQASGGGNRPEDKDEPESILDDVLDMDFDNLDITTEDVSFDEVDEHIQENLEDELVKQALEQGVDLRRYAQEVEQQLRVAEAASIGDYLRESGNIASLHAQIRTCDQLLQGMEQMLGVFQADLGSISSEIQTLQAQSLSMNEKLKNRKEVHSKLGRVVNELVIPPDMIEHITSAEVSESYLEYLTALNLKINFVKKQKGNPDIRCLDEVQPELEKMKTKATDRTREFLYERMLSLRKPNTNIQLLQQNTLLPYKYFMHFLKQHNKQVAQEICGHYVDTMSKIYFSLFKLYLSKLQKLRIEEVADKDDLIGTQEGLKKLFFTSKLAQKANVFTLGERATILNELEEAVIIPHVATQQNSRFHIEQLFRSFNFCVLDNCCHEYLFIVEFFQVKSTTALEIFAAIFDKALTVFKKQFEETLNNSYDTIGVLLCIRIVQHFQKVTQQRRIPALEKYHASLEMMLWPRVKMLLDMNIDSMRKCAMDPRRMGNIETRPHYVTRRYAEFAASISAINQDWKDQQITLTSGRMRLEFEAFLSAMAALFSNPKDQMVFFINNYDLVLAVLGEQNQRGGAEYEHFDRQLHIRIQEYVEEELSPYLGDMVSFVKEYEPRLEQATPTDTITFSTGRVEGIARGFAGDWRRAIDSINADVLQSFTNFRVGTDILQAVLTGLILYYQRFLAIMNQRPFKGLPIRNELINIHHVMVEVKKHRTTF
eukprot:comp51628_c0_seq1/m.47678 comp51628_c0_seq1/g.47678  ORF comp51628_c0_seq1/g.47678 comp51628_c0_seq1/m.47678 type:complete len:716 (-) comp51628_c0_seq1:104-2251(-)